MALFAFTAILTYASTSIIVRWVRHCSLQPPPYSLPHTLTCLRRSLHSADGALFHLLSALHATLRYASRGGFQSYGDLVKHHFGPKGAAILQLAICVHVGKPAGWCVCGGKRCGTGGGPFVSFLLRTRQASALLPLSAAC